METVVITGAGRGIGLALAKRCLASGKRVIATHRTAAAAGELRSLSAAEALRIEPLEVSDAASVASFAARLANERVDVLVNNAGVGGGDRQSVGEMDYDAWARAFEVNAMAPLRLANALLPNLRRATRPRIVTLSSQMGSLHRKSLGAYAYRSSKAALNKVMQVLALELASERIIVCPVHPGWVRTDMGGASADISAEESAAGLHALIDSLTMEHSGRFWTWSGAEHPW